MIFVLALLGCASSPCDHGWEADPDRVKRLAALAGQPVEAAVCFGRVVELGVAQDDGRLLLDAASKDELLAARVVHLPLHGPAPVGPGCVEALRSNEAQAWSAELATRLRLGAADPSCQVVAALGSAPAVDQIERGAAADVGTSEPESAWMLGGGNPRGARALAARATPRVVHYQFR